MDTGTRSTVSRRGFLRAGAACGLSMMALALPGCSGGGAQNGSAPAPAQGHAVDMSDIPLDELIERAREEGTINSVAMPDTWANWVETWNDLNELYGLEHVDQDMSSSEEIAMFKAEGVDGTKDIGDVGQQWGPAAEAEGVTLKYRTSYWDELPAWARDDDGDWVVAYYGTISFISNDRHVPEPPRSFADLLAGDYKVAIGDITAASVAQHALLACAYAFGGGIDDMQPAYDFLRALAEQGRLDTGQASIGRLESGEISVAINWDYNALNYRKQIVEANPRASFTVTIPRDGSVMSGYCTIINVNAPHPHAACLAREYILSDEGQINLARGFATPIRDVELPPDVEAMRIPDDEYGDNIHDIDYEKWETVCQEAVAYYQENIIPLVA